MISISDIHFNQKRPAPPLLGAIERAVLEDPHRVLIFPGDLTCSASRREYQAAYDWLESLIRQGTNVVMAPGNHDTSQSILITRIRLEKGYARYAALASLIASQPVVVACRDQFDMISVIGRDVFFAARTTHHRLHKPTRVRRKQFEWAMDELESRGLVPSNGYRLHLVTHQSLWKLPGDAHEHMHKRRRLVEEFLQPLGFSTAINGHNHGFAAGYRRVKKELPYRLHHIQAPTASHRKTKGGRCRPGYVKWDPARPETTRMAS